MEGWVKIHRKIMDNPAYFSEPFCRNMAWVDLILLANHDTNFFRCRGIRVEVRRGQIGYGLDELGRRWRWSRGKVERFLRELEADKQIVRQKTNVTTLLSIVNYEEHQSDDKAKPKANGQQVIKQTDTNKNDKNDKKNINTPSPAEPVLLKPKDEIHPALVKTWFEFYKQKFDADPTFKAADGKTIKAIRKIAEKRCKDANVEFTVEAAQNWFQVFLSNAYKILWLRANFTLTNIYSRIDTIINTPKDGTATQLTGSAGTSANRVNALEGW
jgi:hypothetical protein